MKVTVVTFNSSEAHKAKEGLAKLKEGISEFKRDLRDNRVDLDTLESFVKGLRVVANYFEGFAEDEPEARQDLPESGIETVDY